VRHALVNGRETGAQCAWPDRLSLELDQRAFEGGACDEDPLAAVSRRDARSAVTLRGIAFALLAFGAVQAASSQESLLTVALTGQAMIRSDLRATDPSALARIRSMMLTADVTFTNLEGAIAEQGQSVHEGRGFLTPPEALDALKAMGFNLLALSDNHAFDLKVTGIVNTLREADLRHLVHAGTGLTLAGAAAPAYLSTAHGRVALVASASGLLPAGARASASQPGINELRVEAGTLPNEASADLPGAPTNHPQADDARRILESIREARRKADLVIVYQHNHVFGNESFSTLFSEGMPERLRPNAWLVKWVHREIDAGADIVVMHGAPLMHGVEIYHGKPIFYDLGNFIYNVPPVLTYIDEPMAWESVIASVEFAHGRLRSVTFRPLVLNVIGEGQPDVHSEFTNNQFLDTRGLPRPASGAKGRYILERLARLSRPFGSRIEIEGDSARLQLEGPRAREVALP
jgi:poly-gamma-glutamate capsule biosynthesis protein CapA/YwtB (metallophosphatase superfamily)